MVRYCDRACGNPSATYITMLYQLQSLFTSLVYLIMFSIFFAVT